MAILDEVLEDLWQMIMMDNTDDAFACDEHVKS